MRENERVLRRREGKTKLRERGGIVSVKTDLTLFIARILTTYCLLYLFIFIIFTKKFLNLFMKKWDVTRNIASSNILLPLNGSFEKIIPFHLRKNINIFFSCSLH